MLWAHNICSVVYALWNILIHFAVEPFFFIVAFHKILLSLKLIASYAFVKCKCIRISVFRVTHTVVYFGLCTPISIVMHVHMFTLNVFFVELKVVTNWSNEWMERKIKLGRNRETIFEFCNLQHCPLNSRLSSKIKPFSVNTHIFLLHSVIMFFSKCFFKEMLIQLNILLCFFISFFSFVNNYCYFDSIH